MSQLQLIKEVFNNFKGSKSDRAYADIKSIIDFWNNPNKCRRCEHYHWSYEKCPSNDRCNRCNEKGHRGTVCNNITYIYNLSYECGCFKWSVEHQRGLSTTKYSTHCCVCHKPKKIYKMQISKDKKRARCNECKNKDERKNNETNKRQTTPPLSPKPNKKNMYEKLDEELETELCNSPEQMDIDPQEESSRQATRRNNDEETTVKKRPKCTCWLRTNKWCEKHEHTPVLTALGLCLSCEELPKGIEENTLTKQNKDEPLQCLKCYRYIDWWSTKATCLKGGYVYCQDCYNKMESDVSIEFYDKQDVKRCLIHFMCLIFDSKMARRRYNEMDREIQIELENKLFAKDLKEFRCQECENVGTMWHNGCEILCKKCDATQTLERDQQNNQFFLKLAGRVIQEKTGIAVTDTNIIKEKKIEKPKLTYEEEEMEKLKDIINQKERENDYIRDHYQKKLKQQEEEFSKRLSEIQTISHQMNENFEKLKETVLIKENRIQELNDTIAQQNQQLEKQQQEIFELGKINQDYFKTIEMLNQQIIYGNQCLNTANLNVDLVVHTTNQNTDQASATTSRLIGPIHIIEYTNENFKRLFEMKNKLDRYEEDNKWTTQLIEITDLIPNLDIYEEIKSYNNQIKPMEIIKETNESKIEEIEEETWSKNSKQNMTTEIPDVFKDLIDIDF